MATFASVTNFLYPTKPWNGGFGYAQTKASPASVRAAIGNCRRVAVRIPPFHNYTSAPSAPLRAVPCSPT